MAFRVSRIWLQRAEPQRGHCAIAQRHDHEVPHDHGGGPHFSRSLEIALALPGPRIEADEERLARPASEARHQDAVAVEEGSRQRPRGKGGGVAGGGARPGARRRAGPARGAGPAPPRTTWFVRAGGGRPPDGAGPHLPLPPPVPRAAAPPGAVWAAGPAGPPARRYRAGP